MTKSIARRRGRRARVSVAGVVLALVGSAVSSPIAHAAGPALFRYGPSDANSLAVLSGVDNHSGGPGTEFWWDHTNLSVAVAAAPGADPAFVQAVHDGIETWSEFLRARFPTVSLTDVTGTARARSADIVLHYAPHSGGVVWGGNAVCGPQRCGNVMLRSEEPPGGPYPDFDTTRAVRTTVHELGHALGLGHAAPLLVSTDIMAYGWVQLATNPDTGKYVYVYSTPILSDCDVAGLGAAFEWALKGEPPHPATVSSIPC